MSYRLEVAGIMLGLLVVGGICIGVLAAVAVVVEHLLVSTLRQLRNLIAWPFLAHKAVKAEGWPWERIEVPTPRRREFWDWWVDGDGNGRIR